MEGEQRRLSPYLFAAGPATNLFSSVGPSLWLLLASLEPALLHSLKGPAAAHAPAGKVAFLLPSEI